MKDLHLIGVDIAKRVFQAHAINGRGETLWTKKLSRPQFERFIREIPATTIAMETCGGAHHWGRVARAVGHEVRLIPPQYVKPYVKRHKSDAIDAAAIAEAATRPGMSFVAVKTEAQQSRSARYRTRDLFVRQRTQLINALRGHLLEFGIALPKGQNSVQPFLRDAKVAVEGEVPQVMKPIAEIYLHQILALTEQINAYERALRKEARENDVMKRMQSMPGIGPITALAVEAFCPPMDDFKRGRNFAAWLGLAPRQNSTGGKLRYGRITKMGQRDIRRLLIIGAMSQIAAARRAPERADPWLLDMLKRKPKLVVGVALANRMARRLWAMLKTGRDYEIQGMAV
ncbi:IS110 family transposase [uncultured Tateyamaria sp.]|uniref:IS110 family transposase n=1 Tax=uncultured Tateyamaria sp. TaxID=455651 RepID=UPI002614038C|nr:IS110 family transposase [uncultured Tateyamaria sp.]